MFPSQHWEQDCPLLQGRLGNMVFVLSWQLACKKGHSHFRRATISATITNMWYFQYTLVNVYVHIPKKLDRRKEKMKWIKLFFASQVLFGAK